MFRGPKGVWTLEQKGEKPNFNISFDEAKPTKSHMALRSLVEHGFICAFLNCIFLLKTQSI